MASFEYSDAQMNTLRAAGPLDNESAQRFADEFGASVHSVRAVAVRNEDIGYTRKPKVSKSGEAVETKADIVAEIATLCGVDAERLESLENATKDNLKIVRGALA